MSNHISFRLVLRLCSLMALKWCGTVGILALNQGVLCVVPVGAVGLTANRRCLANATGLSDRQSRLRSARASLWLPCPQPR